MAPPAAQEEEETALLLWGHSLDWSLWELHSGGNLGPPIGRESRVSPGRQSAGLAPELQAHARGQLIWHGSPEGAG